MAEFLTSAWIAELADAAVGTAAPPEVRLTVQQVVSDGGEGGREVAYAIRIGDGTVTVVPGRVPDAEVTFTQDRVTAAAIARGELAAQVAFLTGRLRVGGDLSAVLADGRSLSGITDVFAAARSATTW